MLGVAREGVESGSGLRGSAYCLFLKRSVVYIGVYCVDAALLKGVLQIQKGERWWWNRTGIEVGRLGRKTALRLPLLAFLDVVELE